VMHQTHGRLKKYSKRLHGTKLAARDFPA
jgi:hypothetical protein